MGKKVEAMIAKHEGCIMKASKVHTFSSNPHDHLVKYDRKFVDGDEHRHLVDQVTIFATKSVTKLGNSTRALSSFMRNLCMEHWETLGKKTSL